MSEKRRRTNQPNVSLVTVQQESVHCGGRAEGTEGQMEASVSEVETGGTGAGVRCGQVERGGKVGQVWRK